MRHRTGSLLLDAGPLLPAAAQNRIRWPIWSTGSQPLGQPSLAARRSRALSALSGAALLAASAATCWGVFYAGLASANDPKYTVVPQRDRLRRGHPSGEPS